MQTQNDKKLDQRKKEARQALGGESIQSTVNADEKDSIKEKKVDEKKFELKKIKTVYKKENAPTENKQTTAPLDDKKNEAFLEKIRSKEKRGKPLATIVEKQIERIIPKNNKQNLSKIQTIRTYKNDIAETIKNKKKSLTQIVIKEKKKKEAISVKKIPKTTPKKKKNVLLITGIFILIASGITAIYQLNNTLLLPKITNKTNKIVTPRVQTLPVSPSIVQANTENQIDILTDGDKLQQIISKEINTRYDKNNIENIYLYKNTDTTYNGKLIQKKEPATVGDFITLWKSNIPNTLARSLDNKFMIGVYSTNTATNTPFLILKTDSYSQTFAGMIEWEKMLYSDFTKLFSIKLPTKTDTAFLDEVIDGKDTRVLTNTDGKILIIYSFVNKNTIIMTTNKETFGALLQKI